jgi:FkbM family methyltransferase
MDLYKFNLKKLDIPIELYFNSLGLSFHLNFKQYEYSNNNISIKINNGDIVLDCGACYGDTALFFAEAVKEKGHIYSFEFIPENTKIFNINIDLNPVLKERITLVPLPLSETSDKELYYSDNGPGSRVSELPLPNSKKIKTCHIDGFFSEYDLKRVDFIKMDIEGSELPALKGGINTIRKYVPKLAISIYHSMDDFVNIVHYLKSLDLGYKFYLNHGTFWEEETVLFAISEN